MLISHFQHSIQNNVPKFQIHNMSDFFHTWIKRNCFMIENNIYELDIENLMYLHILLYEMEKLDKIYHLIDVDYFKKDIHSKYKNELVDCATFPQELYVQEKYQRVYFVIDEYLSLFNKNGDSFKNNIERIKNLLSVLDKYACKTNTNTLYYHFSKE